MFFVFCFMIRNHKWGCGSLNVLCVHSQDRDHDCTIIFKRVFKNVLKKIVLTQVYKDCLCVLKSECIYFVNVYLLMLLFVLHWAYWLKACVSESSILNHIFTSSRNFCKTTYTRRNTFTLKEVNCVDAMSIPHVFFPSNDLCDLCLFIRRPWRKTWLFTVELDF